MPAEETMAEAEEAAPEEAAASPAGECPDGQSYGSDAFMQALSQEDAQLTMGVMNRLGQDQIPFQDSETNCIMKGGDGSVWLTMKFGEGYSHDTLGAIDTYELQCVPGDGNWTCAPPE